MAPMRNRSPDIEAWFEAYEDLADKPPALHGLVTARVMSRA